MTYFPRTRIAALSLSGLLLAACATPTPPPPSNALVARAGEISQDYHRLAVTNPGTVYTLDPKTSKIRIYVFRGGAAAASGHDHVLSAPKFTGYAEIPGTDYGNARFDLEFRLADLVMDDPATRTATGGVFAPILSEGDRAATRDHMLSARGFDAEHYPFVEIHSVSITGDAPLAVAKVAITLHGVTHEQDVPLHVAVNGNAVIVHGSFALRQSDYGVSPYSVLGGLLSVKDAVLIDFDLQGKMLSLSQESQ